MIGKVKWCLARLGMARRYTVRRSGVKLSIVWRCPVWRCGTLYGKVQARFYSVWYRGAAQREAVICVVWFAKVLWGMARSCVAKYCSEGHGWLGFYGVRNGGVV